MKQVAYNSAMRKRHLLAIAILACLCSCGGEKGVVNQASTNLQPYETMTPSATASPFSPTIEIVLPTPTPITYLVEPNDTLIGIAAKFDVSVDDLMAANPGVYPLYLLEGDILIIPTGNNIPTEPTPSPLPVSVRSVGCHPTTDRGLWCFALVKNDYAENLENLSAMIVLIDNTGQEVTSQVAYGPLDILQPGQTMPLAVFFQPPMPTDVSPRAYILTAIRLPPSDPRYLSIVLQNTSVTVAWNGFTADVSGQAILAGDEMAARLVWILGVAYDADGNAVGFKRWQSSTILEPDHSLGFDFTISSLGPSIARVELLSEARP